MARPCTAKEMTGAGCAVKWGRFPNSFRKQRS